MSEGKFSQPRPHRDEERQIEESFRQLTEDKHRRKKVYTVEDDISRTVQDIAAQNTSVPEDNVRLFERSTRLEETIQAAPGQEHLRQPGPTRTQETYAAPKRQTYAPPAQQVYNTQPEASHTGQPQQPYGSQPRQTYTGQPQQPYGSQPRQTYTGQPQQPYGSQPRQTYTGQPQQPYGTQPRQTYTGQPQQPYGSQPRQSYTAQNRQNAAVPDRSHGFTEEDMDLLFEDPYTAPKRPFPQQPIFPEETEAEEEPDFIDKLLNLGKSFKKHQTPIILGLCGAAVLLIVLFVSVFLTGSKDSSLGDVIFPNVYVADIALGGMTKNEAITALKNATQNTYTALDMVIDLSGTEIRLSPKNTKANLDAKAAAEAAFAYGRTGSKQQQEQAYQDALEEEHIIAALPYLQLDVEYIQDVLYDYAADTGSTLTQTSYGLEGDEPELSADKFNEKAPTQTLVIIMGTPGIGFDAKDVYEKVLDAYSLHQFLVEVENVESVTQPDPIDLEEIYEEFYIKPVNASVNLQNFKTEAGSYGYGFDLEAAQKLVDKAQPGEVLRIPMEYIAPDILEGDAFYKDTLGEHQTRSTGNDDRNRNLQLACDAIDGTILNPGESLSFSSLMNKVSGFRTAPEDAGREEVQQGGVSQVASTLYYAALMSDLNIASRSNHAYLPSFIDYGLDATSSLKISNTTGYPIQIQAEYSGGYVKVEILGTEERDYYVMLESSISSSTSPETVYQEFPYDNDEGYEDGDVIEEGSAGYLVKSYRVRYDRKTGKELSRDFITNSQYAATDRIIARVEAPPETEPPTEPPTEAPTEAPTLPPTEPSMEPSAPPTTDEAPPSSEMTQEQSLQEEQSSQDDHFSQNHWPQFPFGPGRW